MVEQVTTIRNTLGECPVWSPAESTMYWMDLIERVLYRVSITDGKTESWHLPEYLGGLALRDKGGLVVGMQHRIAGFDPATSELEDLFVFPEKRGEGIRFNDGKCDAAGRFLVGNMKDETLAFDGSKDKEGAGSIYSLGVDMSFNVLETVFTIPNGLTWSLDNLTMYMADSHEHTIYAYEYNIASGALGDRRIFASTAKNDGVPDGACLDEEGYLWTAVNGGWRIARYSPDGKLDREIKLPVAMPTSVAFGGCRLDRLFITTATQGMNKEALKEQPLAGTVLAVNPGVHGAPVFSYGG